MSDAPSPGSVLREALSAANLTQGQLAIALKIKTTSGICELCRDKRRITPKMARRISLVTGCDMAKLLQAQALWDARDTQSEPTAC